MKSLLPAIAGGNASQSASHGRVCVRERVTPGSVAVLINRAHTFTDLILTVDAFEDRLLGLIDGKRTLAEILKVGGKDVDERRAVSFFDRLWQNDQVVFDASRATNRSRRTRQYDELSELTVIRQKRR